MEVQGIRDSNSKRYYPRKYKRLFLQDRDVEIFKYTLEQKFLTVQQVAQRFFPAGTEVKDKIQAGYRRILTLQKFDMVKLTPILTGEKVMIVTRNGASQLDNRGHDRFGVIQSVDYRYFEHDRRVTDVRIILERLDLLTSWNSERLLKKTYQQATRVPDAVFILKNGQRGALEVEIAKKAVDRYQNIFQDYVRKQYGSLDLVFYICNSMTQLETLAELSKETKWIYFALYDQLMERGEDTIFANKTDHFQLKDIQ